MEEVNQASTEEYSESLDLEAKALPEKQSSQILDADAESYNAAVKAPSLAPVVQCPVSS